jgi:hypothetical protein
MFTALDTEGQISMQRSSAWLQQSERINGLTCVQESWRPGAVQAYITAALRTAVDACPVLRVAFPPPVSADQLTAGR